MNIVAAVKRGGQHFRDVPPFDVVNLREPIPRTRSSKVEQKSGERVSPVDLDQ